MKYGVFPGLLAARFALVLGCGPRAASIAVSRDGVAVPGSQIPTWDYRASSNSIVFFNMPFDAVNPSDIVVSYRRWENQIPIE